MSINMILIMLSDLDLGIYSKKSSADSITAEDFVN
jgi:hypothetical protein